MNKLSNYKKTLKRDGTVLIDGISSFFEESDFNLLEELLNKLPKEFVTIGDAGEKNSVTVSRIMTDVDKPKIVNSKISKKILSILNRKYLKKLKYITGKNKIFIRRAQLNIMGKNSFVGYHLDTDSNPDYLYAVVLQFGTDFKGGEYRVHKNNKYTDYMPNLKSVIISDCNLPHEVRKVKKGKRSSFVFFLSSHKNKNKRIH